MRPAFLTELDLRAYGAKNWILLSRLVYCGKNRPARIEVPIGFVTDLASIPRLARLIFPVNDLHRPAAVVHDYLYQYQKIGGQWINRKEADRVFLEAMRCLGVPKRKAWPMYLAVRAGGWVFFNRQARALGNPHYRGRP